MSLGRARFDQPQTAVIRTGCSITCGPIDPNGDNLAFDDAAPRITRTRLSDHYGACTTCAHRFRHRSLDARPPTPLAVYAGAITDPSFRCADTSGHRVFVLAAASAADRHIGAGPGGLIVRMFWDTQHACLVRPERLHDLAMTAASVILMLAIASGKNGT